MKIMATTCPNQGHFYPMVPLLWALRNNAHDVLAAMPGGAFTQLAMSAGLPAISLGEPIDIGHRNDAASEPITQAHDVASLIEHVLTYYVPLAGRAVAATVQLAERWRPDVILHSPWEYAGPIAAARLGIPSVLQVWGVKPPAEIDRPVAEALSVLYEAWGVLAQQCGSWRWMDPCPPTLQGYVPDARAFPMSYVPYNGSAAVPSWLLEPRTRPRLCVTLGNIPVMGDHASVLSQVLSAVRDLNVEVVVAASSNLAPPDQLPGCVRFVENLPLSQLLPTCDGVVHHGGAGSTMTSTANGLPQLVLPLMCVQYQHAEQIQAVGAGLTLDPGRVNVESVRSAIVSVLDDSRLRARARLLRRECNGRPRPAEAARRLHDAVTAADAAQTSASEPAASLAGVAAADDANRLAMGSVRR